MSELDPRIHAFRPDLADEALQGRVQSRRFVEGQAHHVCARILPLRKMPDSSLGYESELLFGERVQVFESREGWSWVQAARDGYVGYCISDGLKSGGLSPTHHVKVPRSHLYATPSIKTAPITALPYGSVLEINAEEGRFSRVGGPLPGYIIADHLAQIGLNPSDPVAEAERFLGAPYLWGGKSSEGLDCSALVQTACFACGIEAPRDSDMQEARLGHRINLPDDFAALPRGALLFWPGHVAISQGNGFMIHANAHHMQVVSEAIEPAIARIAAAGSALRSVRILPGLSSGSALP